MRSPNGNSTAWDTSWVAALTVIKKAQRVFTPGNRPPGELIPLVEPLIRLGDALRAQPRDEAVARRYAQDLVADDALIKFACRSDMPPEIRDFGFSLAWLAMTLSK